MITLCIGDYNRASFIYSWKHNTPLCTLINTDEVELNSINMYTLDHIEEEQASVIAVCACSGLLALGLDQKHYTVSPTDSHHFWEIMRCKWLAGCSLDGPVFWINYTNVRQFVVSHSFFKNVQMLLSAFLSCDVFFPLLCIAVVYWSLVLTFGLYCSGA